MKRLVIFLVVMTFAGACWGQMTPKYDTYTTYSLDSNLVIYQTVVVEGYTTTPTGSCNTTCCQGSSYPPYYSCWSCPIPGCVGSTHTPSVENVLGSAGGWSTGPPSDPFAYMSYQTTTSVQGQDGQGGIGSATDATVTCSVAGGIFGPPPTFPQIELAITFNKMRPTQAPPAGCVTSNGVTECNYDTMPWCTLATTPPDDLLTGVVQVFPATYPAYWYTYAACERPGPGFAWLCTPAFTGNALEAPDNFPLQVCTKHP